MSREQLRTRVGQQPGRPPACPPARFGLALIAAVRSSAPVRRSVEECVHAPPWFPLQRVLRRNSAADTTGRTHEVRTTRAATAWGMASKGRRTHRPPVALWFRSAFPSSPSRIPRWELTVLECLRRADRDAPQRPSLVYSETIGMAPWRVWVSENIYHAWYVLVIHACRGG